MKNMINESKEKVKEMSALSFLVYFMALESDPEKRRQSAMEIIADIEEMQYVLETILPDMKAKEVQSL